MPRSQSESKQIDSLVRNLDEYEVQKPLGSGGMGLIYLVRQRLTNRLEVIKVLRPELANQKRLKDRFLREVQIAAKLDHPNVVKTYTAIDRGFLGLVLEYVPGMDLESMVRTHGPLKVDVAASIIAQAARGLDYAVSRGLVHRDIKPSNILINNVGGTFQAKLSDFGLCKDIELQELGGLTLEGRFLGTAEYVSPEQALDPSNCTVAADVYGLGCTLYFAITGTPPYKGTNTIAVLNQHINSPIPNIRNFRQDVPEQVALLLEAMLQKDSRLRIQSPLQVANTLEALTSVSEVFAVAELPLMPSQSGTLPPRRRPAKKKSKNRVPLAIIAQVLMPLMLLAAALYLQPWAAPTGPGTLSIADITPGVTLEVDGTAFQLGQNKSTELSLSAGNHTVRFLYAGQEITKREIAIQPRGRFELSASFTGLAERFGERVRKKGLPKPLPKPPTESIAETRDTEGPIPVKPETPELKPPANQSFAKPPLVPIDENLMSWNAEHDRTLTSTSEPTRLAFVSRDISPTGNEIIVQLGRRGAAWDAKLGTAIQLAMPFPDVVGLVVAPNEKSVLCFDDFNCEVRILAKQKYISWFKSSLDSGTKRVFAISSDSKSLGCCDFNESFSKWGLQLRKLESSVSSSHPVGSEKILAIALTPRLDRSVVLSTDGKLICWDTDNGHAAADAEIDLEQPIGLHLVNQTNQVVIVSSDGELQIRKLLTLELQLENAVLGGEAVLSCSSGRILAVADRLGAVAVVDVVDAKVIARIGAAKDKRAKALALSQDAKHLAIGYDDSTISIFVFKRLTAPKTDVIRAVDIQRE